MTALVNSVPSGAVYAQQRRAEACQLFIDGFDSIEKSFCIYEELDLGINDLAQDLADRGWDGSIHKLRRIQTKLRKEGRLAPSSKTGRPPNSQKCELDAEPVENSTPTPTPLPVIEAEIVTDDCIIPTNTAPVPTGQSRPEPYRNPAAAQRELTDQVGSEDYVRVIQLSNDISDILKKHAFRGTFSISEWTSCLGSFQSLVAVASAQHNNVQQYAGMEQGADWA